MKETICTGNTLLVHEEGYPDDTYEIVSELPQGYIIWNIGEHAPEGYLPLCCLKAIQPYPGCREIETDTLKAIKTPGAQEILRTSVRGYDNAAKMRKCIERSTDADDVERCKKALPFMEELESRRA